MLSDDPEPLLTRDWLVWAIRRSLAVLQSIQPDLHTRWQRYLAQRQGQSVDWSLVRCSDGVYREEPFAQQFEGAQLQRFAREQMVIAGRDHRPFGGG